MQNVLFSVSFSRPLCLRFLREDLSLARSDTRFSVSGGTGEPYLCLLNGLPKVMFSSTVALSSQDFWAAYATE